MTTYTIPLVLSSNVNNGATNKSSDGSTFSVDLDKPILVPKEAHHCYIQVQSATVWNTVPNIVEGVNDKFYFSYNGNNYVLTIEQGQYDLTA